MLIEDQHPDNKSIVVSVLGAPNVGKSSLINYLIGMDLSIVTSKPQTTRNKFHCIMTVDKTEIVFVDTPGLHKSSQELNKRINQQAREGMDGADVNLLLIDLSKDIMVQFTDFKENLKRDISRVWVVFNKSDRIENAKELPLSMVIDKAREIIPTIEKHFCISSKTGDSVHELTGAICDAAESGRHYYGDGSISNKNQRFFATEYIREQAFALLKEELPYEIAVVIEEYKDIKGKDPKDFVSHISASILVNRPSQRAIVVGTKGSMIKEIGTNARKKIEAMTDGKVFLNLHVKVSPKWFKNNFVLEEIGLNRVADSARVWRQK